MYTDLYKPFRKKGSLGNEIDNLSHRNFGGSMTTGMLAGEWLPPVVVAETESDVTYTAQLPGLKAEEIDISIDNNVLSIIGEKKQDIHASDAPHHKLGERFYGSVTQTIKLPFNVVIESLNAHYLNGVLTIKIPKLNKAMHKKVNLKTDFGGHPAAAPEEYSGVDHDKDDLS